jgi:N-acetylglucosaminyl-diphospho-decaprenol L-rhamnosyltransferase
LPELYEPTPGTLADRVDAVVVDLNSGEALARCVRSLHEAGASRVVVVDNAVPPGRSRTVLGAVPGADFVEPGTNLGYGSGVNRGAGTCTSELLVVCNPDVVVEREAVVHLVKALDSDHGVAIVGPLVLEPDGTRYPSARRFPSLVEGAGHALAGLLAPHNRFTRRYRMEDENTAGTKKVDWVSGSFMLVRRKVFEELGGFDEAYFMYGEDVDLCWRAHMAGWAVAYVPSASVTHDRGMTTRRTPYRMLACHHRSALRFASRTLTGPRRLALPAVAVALGLRLVAEVVREALRSAAAGARLSDG